MLQLVHDHPIMGVALREKLDYLYKQLSQLPEDTFEPRIRLLFGGNAVKGALGIKSSFIGKTIPRIQELIKTQTALTRFGRVARRGQAQQAEASELFLTSLPTGSFGFELSQLNTNNLFDEIDVSNSIKQVIHLIEYTAKSDEQFESIVDTSPKRSINNLRRFFKEVSDENSIIKMESGDLYVEISENEVKNGYSRISSATYEGNEIFVVGVLRGFLLDSGKFEIINESGQRISGFISEKLSEDEIIEYDRRFLNQQCRIHLQANTIRFRTGNVKTTYDLIEISNV
jgi:hypothetical protein